MGAFIFKNSFLVLEGNKSLSYYSVSTESVNTLDLAKTSLKVEIIIFGRRNLIKVPTLKMKENIAR